MEDRGTVDAIDMKCEYKILFKFECVEKREKKEKRESVGEYAKEKKRCVWE